MIAADEILDDAIDALSAAPGSEARQRAVTCRAYYACYHYLLKHPCGAPFAATMVGRKGGLHRDFIEWLYKSKEPNVQLVAMKLDGLFDDRVDADYHIHKRFHSNKAQDAIDAASEILDADLKAYNAQIDIRP